MNITIKAVKTAESASSMPAEFEASAMDFVGAQAHLFMIVDTWAAENLDNEEYDHFIANSDSLTIIGALAEVGYTITITQ